MPTSASPTSERPPATLGAIEAGGTKFVMALADARGAIVERARIPTRGPAETFADVATFFRAASERRGPVAAFGVASFGPIDIDPASSAYGTFTCTPKPGWSGARFHPALAAFGAPIALVSDVDGAALGEALHGAGRGCRTLAYTTVGTGIGTGVARDGRPLAGLSHYEMGHVRVPHDLARDPFPGACPFHGDCLEGLASGPAILARWGHDLSSAAPEQIALIAGYLGTFAANLVLTHMPERLIFGGGVMKAPGLIDALRDATRASLAGYIAGWDRSLTQRIVTPELGDDAGITGALELAKQAALLP
ncbi:MAG: ROK family protein [Tsuneonella sp.]